jgi:hypothetical protein
VSKAIEVMTSVERRRRWSAAEKEHLVAASLEPSASVVVCPDSFAPLVWLSGSGPGSRGDGSSHLLILWQPDIEISLGRPCRTG